jgi:hypothetical protein
MVNVVFSGDNVTVLGGPSKLDVDLNIGANGERGSIFFVGNSNPNTLNILTDFVLPPILFDIFINVNPSSEDYLQAYQYVARDNGNVWTPVFKILQEGFRANKVLDFSNGEATVDINISEIGLDSVPFDSLTTSFAYFNVQATLNNINLNDLSEPSKPAAISVEVGDAFFGNEGSFDPGEFPLFLPITFRAAEFDGSSWTPINEKRNVVYLSVSFSNPNEIFTNLTPEGDES